MIEETTKIPSQTKPIVPSQSQVKPQAKPQVIKYILLGILGLLLLAGTTYAGYWYGTKSEKLSPRADQPLVEKPQILTPTPVSTLEPTPAATNANFLEKIVKSYSFINSKGILKKIAVYDTGDIQIGAYIYLTDASFNPLTAIKIGQFSTACCEVTDMLLSDTEKKLVAIRISDPGIHVYILADEEGNVISDSVVTDNASEIGLGTVIRPQYGVTSGEFRFDKSGTFVLTIMNGYGEEYRVEIDGFTGKYIEGSRRKIK